MIHYESVDKMTKSELITSFTSARDSIKKYSIEAIQSSKALKEFEVASADATKEIEHLHGKFRHIMVAIETVAAIKHPTAIFAPYTCMPDPAPVEPEDLLLLRYLYSLCDTYQITSLSRDDVRRYTG